MAEEMKKEEERRDEPAPEQQGPGLLATILAIAGFIILVIIIIWGASHLFSIASSGISNFLDRFRGGDSREIQLTLSADTVDSGSPLDIQWEHTPESGVSGTYAFIYQCREGFQFRTPSAEGELVAIPCGSTYTFTPDGKSARLIPVLSGDAQSVNIPLSIVFLPTTGGDEARAQGTATVTVRRAGAAAPPPAATTTPPVSTTPPPPPPPAQPRYVDLVVRILAVGVIDQWSGAFIERAPYSSAETTAVRFEIANRGTVHSGTYTFIAQLPTAQGFTYTSPLQMSLGPGDRIENTLRFTQLAPQGGTFTVFVDPMHLIKESNKANNSASRYVAPASGYQQQPYQQYHYGY